MVRINCGNSLTEISKRVRENCCLVAKLFLCNSKQSHLTQTGQNYLKKICNDNLTLGIIFEALKTENEVEQYRDIDTSWKSLF